MLSCAPHYTANRLARWIAAGKYRGLPPRANGRRAVAEGVTRGGKPGRRVGRWGEVMGEGRCWLIGDVCIGIGLEEGV